MASNAPSTSYPYVLLTACTLMYMIMSGGLKSFGVVYVELLDYYGTGSGETAWISSLGFGLICALGPYANYLGVIHTFRKVMFIGGFFGFLGLLFSAFLPRMEFWYITYGMITGTGTGFVLAPCTTVANFYFDKRRTLANGIIVSGSGIGSIILPYIFTFLIDVYSIKGAILIISAIYFHLCVGALLVRQPPQIRHSKSESEQGKKAFKMDDSNQNKPRRKRPVFHFSLFKNKSFAIYLLGIAVNALAYGTNFTTIPGFAKQINLNENQIATTISVFGGMEVVGRITLGLLVDTIREKTRIVLALCCLIGGTSCIVIPFFGSFEALVVHAVVSGLSTGAFLPLMPTLMLEVYTLKDLPAAQGLVYLVMGFPLLIGQPISGWLEDAIGTWNLSLRLFGGVYIVAATLFLTEPLMRRRPLCCHLKTKTKYDISNSKQ